MTHQTDQQKETIKLLSETINICLGQYRKYKKYSFLNVANDLNQKLKTIAGRDYTQANKISAEIDARLKEVRKTAKYKYGLDLEKGVTNEQFIWYCDAKIAECPTKSSYYEKLKQKFA